MRSLRLLILCLSCCTASSVAQVVDLRLVHHDTATLVRGPYLNMALQTSVVIHWRTDLATNSLVRYGTAPDNLSRFETDPNLTKEHVVTLTGLSPNTRYYYSIGSTTQLLQGDSDNYFQTMPAPGSTQKIRVLAMGDMGNNSANQVNVRDAWLAFNGAEYTNAWLLLGDNAYSAGSDAEYQSNFFNIYQGRLTRNHVLWPAVGNHDYANSSLRQVDHAIPYYDIFTLPDNGQAGGIPSNTEAYYSYNYGNVHFVALDSYGLEAGNTRLYDTLGPQVDWLKRDLAANIQAWTIVYFHHPPYTKGSHNSDTEQDLVQLREHIVPILERYNVDLVLNGHSHSYERSYLINGHYGLENSFDVNEHALSASNAHFDGTIHSCAYVKNKEDMHNGIVYAVVGSAGQIGGQTLGYPHDAMCFSDVLHGGALYLEIENNRLKGQWVCADGQIRDAFNILKDVNKIHNINILSGEGLNLSASWIGSYNWSTGAKTPFISVRPTANSSYVVTDGTGCLTDVFNVTIGDVFQDPGLAQTPSFRIAPNPVHDVLTLKINGLKTTCNIQVFDLNGKVVFKKNGSAPTTTFDIQSLAKGLYLLVITDEDENIVYYRAPFFKA
jgi:3',5'-cyclic AMP phosphodiesterase CpdA